MIRRELREKALTHVELRTQMQRARTRHFFDDEFQYFECVVLGQEQEYDAFEDFEDVEHLPARLRNLSGHLWYYAIRLADHALPVFAMYFRYELYVSRRGLVELTEYMATMKRMAAYERSLLLAVLRKDMFSLCERHLPFMTSYLKDEEQEEDNNNN